MRISRFVRAFLSPAAPPPTRGCAGGRPLGIAAAASDSLSMLPPPSGFRGVAAAGVDAAAGVAAAALPLSTPSRSPSSSTGTSSGRDDVGTLACSLSWTSSRDRTPLWLCRGSVCAGEEGLACCVLVRR
eukprot:354058-Chlamydomonas_euryale.AAC.2